MMPGDDRRWQLRMGANLVAGGVAFRVWAPHATTVAVDLGERRLPLTREGGGIWSTIAAAAGAGTRYRFRLDDRWSYTDPYTRSQPEGSHGPSQVVDPAYAWRDAAWRGLSTTGLAIYEVHVGAFTREGTFDALAAELDEVAALGVTAIELMPVVEFPGGRNWGYDGVDLFAPSHVYGGPLALKRLVDAAHARGLGVILDVVYNHFGPDGNYLLEFAPEYLSSRHQTAWGAAVNFDGPGSERVRQYFIDNACFWLTEYHIDGLRFDAAFAIIDSSPRHILREIAETARAAVAPRRVVMIGETYENDVRYVRPARQGGLGFDAVWADDFHHAVHTAASHEHSGYYRDYRGTLAELARTIEQGWLYDGRHRSPAGEIHGTDASHERAEAFVYFIQDHDQVGNRAFGRRLSQLVGAEMQRAWAALHLLLPYTPMLFMGQEFAASSRFFYFTDHEAELGHSIAERRRREFARFEEFADPRQRREIPDPQDIETFQASKLDLRERAEGIGAQMLALHRALLALRRDDAVLRHQDRHHMRAVAASDQLLLVHMWHGRQHRLVVANTGLAIDAPLAVACVPRELAAPSWRCDLSTDERRFGGAGDAIRFDAAMVSLPPHSTAWLSAEAPSRWRLPAAPIRLLPWRRRAV